MSARLHPPAGGGGGLGGCGVVPQQPPSLTPDWSSHDSASAQEWGAPAGDFLDELGGFLLQELREGELVCVQGRPGTVKLSCRSPGLEV